MRGQVAGLKSHAEEGGQGYVLVLKLPGRVWHLVLRTAGTHQESPPRTPCSVSLLFSRLGTWTAKGELTCCNLFIPSFQPWK